MSLSSPQIKALLSLVANATEDDVCCDDCSDHVAQFAETELAGLSPCDSMKKIRNHMQNCPCCNDEFNALIAALREVGETDCNA